MRRKKQRESKVRMTTCRWRVLLPAASHSRLCAGDHLRLLENGKKGWGEKATPVLSAAALCECCFCHPIEKPSGAEEEKEKPSFFCVCVRAKSQALVHPLWKTAFWEGVFLYSTFKLVRDVEWGYPRIANAVCCFLRIPCAFFFFCVFRLRKLKTALLHMEFHFFLFVLSPPSLFPLFLFFFFLMF